MTQFAGAPDFCVRAEDAMARAAWELPSNLPELPARETMRSKTKAKGAWPRRPRKMESPRSSRMLRTMRCRTKMSEQRLSAEARASFVHQSADP